MVKKIIAVICVLSLVIVAGCFTVSAAEIDYVKNLSMTTDVLFQSWVDMHESYKENGRVVYSTENYTYEARGQRFYDWYGNLRPGGTESPDIFYYTPFLYHLDTSSLEGRYGTFKFTCFVIQYTTGAYKGGFMSVNTGIENNTKSNVPLDLETINQGISGAAANTILGYHCIYTGVMPSTIDFTIVCNNRYKGEVTSFRVVCCDISFVPSGPTSEDQETVDKVDELESGLIQDNDPTEDANQIYDDVGGYISTPKIQYAFYFVGNMFEWFLLGDYKYLWQISLMFGVLSALLGVAVTAYRRR